MTKTRNFCYTKFTLEDIRFSQWEAIPCRYHIYGHETCPETGREHLQGFIIFKSQKTLSAAIKALPGCHVTAANGSPSENIAYCSKDGDFWSTGDPPVTNKEKGELGAAVYAAAYESAKLGNLDDIPATLRTRFYNTYKSIAADHEEIPLPLAEKKVGIWLYGASNIGKTTWVMTNYPNIYRKDPKTKWFERYSAGQPLLLDDISPYSVGSSDWFKEWCDRWPFMAEYKGGSRMIRPPAVIITSQYTPYDVWPDPIKDGPTRDAIMNRFVLKTLRNYELIDFSVYTN